MGFWEKVLPGYKGYREREDSRNTDKLLREFLTNRLKAARSRFDDCKLGLTRKKALELLNDAEKVTQVLSRVIDRLRYANYGFTGRWFGKDKIDVERLDKVHAYDQKLGERVEALETDIKDLEAADDVKQIGERLRELVSAARDMDEALNGREEILRTVGGKPE